MAMGMAVVSAVLMTSLNEKGVGTLSMIGIVQAQQQQGIWFAFKFFPLGLIALIIFAIAIIPIFGAVANVGIESAAFARHNTRWASGLAGAAVGGLLGYTAAQLFL